MDITLLAPEFKAGIWYKYFSCKGMDKKNKTLNAIINEKLRFYKLYYPFLETKQICGKAYEELGIPHICGDVNRKELYKLYLQERKKQLMLMKKSRKYKNNAHKYATLPIKNISRKNNNPKSPVHPLAAKCTQATVITSQKKVENSKLDTFFDKLLSSSNDIKTVAIEEAIEERFSKKTRSVRFNNGIEIHRVSPLQPMYKLKPLGRLFDEPCSLNEQSHTSQEIEEEIFESDSEYDADTGIMSDNDDDDFFEVLPQGKQITPEERTSQKQEIISEQTETRTIYDLPEDELSGTDSDITKEGYDLILSSKIIKVAQGKWLRETERFVENNNEDKSSRNSNAIVEGEERSKSRSQGPKIIRSAIQVEQNVTIDESLIEKINSLQISRLSEQEGTDSQLCSIQDDRKDSGEKINREDKITRKRTFSYEIPLKKKTNNLKISLENNFNKNLVDEEIFAIDADKLVCTEDLFSNTGTEKDLEKRVRNIPDKLPDDDSDLINDWSSSNKSIPDEKLQNIDALQNMESKRNKSKLTDVTTARKLDLNKKLNIQNSLEIISPEKHKHSTEMIKNALDRETNYSDEKDSVQLKIVTDIIEHSSPLPGMLDPLHIEETLYQRGEKINVLATSSPVVANIKNKKQPSSRKETRKQNKDKVNCSSTALTRSVVDITKSIIIKSKGFKKEDDYDFSYIRSKPKSKCKLTLYKSKPSKDSSDNISEPYENLFLKKKVMNIGDNQPEKKEPFYERDIFKKELSTINADGLINGKIENDINKLQLCSTSVIEMSLTNDSESTSIISHSKDMLDINEGGISKAFNTDQKIDMGNNQSSQETAELYEGQIIIKEELGDISYLSKVQMWSIKSKDYLANFPLLPEPLSAISSSNKGLSERKITNTGEEVNKDCGSLDNQLETSLVFEGNESSTGLDNDIDTLTHESSFKKSESESGEEHYSETESSFGTVRTSNYFSDEVSTAYETDPDTGKLRMNRHLKPIATSTPVALPSRMNRQEHPTTERESNEDYRCSEVSLNCSESPDHNFEKDNNQLSTKAETKRDDFALEPNFEGYLKTPNHNHENETHNVNNPHKSHLPSVNTKVNLKSMTKTSAITNINHKHDETNKIESNNEIKNGGFSDQQCDNDKTSSESIIENSDPDFSRKSRIVKDNKQLEVTSKQISTEKQEITAIINKSAFNVTDQQRDNNKSLSESIIENSNSNTFNEKLTMNITPTAHHMRIKKEAYNEIVLSSGSIIKNSDSIISYSEFPTGKYTKNLSATTDQVIQQEIMSDERNSQILINNTDQKTKKVFTNTKQNEAAASRFKASNDNTIPDPRKVSETNYDFDESNDIESQKHYASLDPQILRNQPSYPLRKSHITFLIRNNATKESCDSETDAQSVDSLETKPQPDLGKNINNQMGCFTPIDKSDPVNNDGFVDNDKSGISKIQNQIISDSVYEEDQVLPSLSEAHKYDNRSMDPISLKRKLKTIHEISYESTNSLSSDDGIIQDITSTSSTIIQSTTGCNTETSAAAESGSLKINCKRINTNIRKKRAKLIKENPARRSITSSSEDDLKMPQPLKIKSRLLPDNSNSIQANSSQDTLDFDYNNKLFKEEIMKESSINQDEDLVKYNFSNLPISSENETKHQKSQIVNSLITKSDMNKKAHVSNNLQKVTCSGSITNINFSRAELSESLEVEAGLKKETRPYNKFPTDTSPILKKKISGKTPLSINNDCVGSEHINTSPMRIKQEKEEGRYVSEMFPSHNEENDKSQKSFQQYRQGGANKENTSINLRRSKRNSSDISLENTNPKELNAYTSNDVIGPKRKKKLPEKCEEDGLINRNKEKNVKSSVVRWVGNFETSQIDNSPEVNTLLRRTYYMGNN